MTIPGITSFSTTRVGESFLDYFQNLGYKIIPGSLLLDDSIPMSFVMSAGMVQFERMAGKKRGGDHFALIQNCFRYFDLERIGESGVHLSLFQMPGAFDFGPVDRQRTVDRIWSLLTDVYGLDPDCLVVTYFGGGEVDGQYLPSDVDTALAWRKAGLPADRIFSLGAESNFWSQTRMAVGSNVSRKRGPNTEVFFDRGEAYGCGSACKPGCACGRYVEFLNTLFITLQYDPASRQLVDIEEPFTEVVIGQERLAMILQAKASVFETDAIFSLIQQLRCFSKPLPVEIEGLEPLKFEWILVDHLRALLFLTADGAPAPGKGGRARLMRKLIRELLTGQRLLGISDPGFIRTMILTALDLYPHCEGGRDRLLEYVAVEAGRFEQTVQVGLYDLEAILRQGAGRISREDGLALEKKHGLPLPLLRYRLWQKNIDFHQSEPPGNISGSGTPESLKGPSQTNQPQKSASANDVANAFLDYHRIRGYQVLPGSSLLDDSIPMSFVMSAGLVQVERAAAPLSDLMNGRFVLLQNCFRHFDLDRIGPSNTHLSFFRMLGAFTYNPVDRQEQIVMAWDLITRIYGLSIEKLWVTYFGGGTTAGKDFGPDLDTCHAWRRVGIRESQLLGQGVETNFWQQSALLMGAEHASKCGPNSEVFYDHGEEFCCGPDCHPGCACGRFIEFLNMLFITHVVDEGSQQVSELETTFTEMVIGLERLAMILQGADSVYEIDCLQPLLLHIRQLSGNSQLEVPHRFVQEMILADHLRALLFLAADGAPPPGKGGRAYIVRRLAREILVSLELLGIRAPAHISELFAQVAYLYRRSRPTWKEAEISAFEYITSEKARLENTLNKGFSHVNRFLLEKNAQWVSGVDILTFEKQYGLPLPLVERYLQAKKIVFNPGAIKAAEALWKVEQSGNADLT